MSTLSPRLSTDLKTLRSRFTHWRHHRSNPTQAIPQELLITAYRLTKQHSTTLILSTLGLNHTQLKRGKTAVLVNPDKRENNHSEPNRFVEV